MNIKELQIEMIKQDISIPELAEKIGISKKTLYSRIKEETPFRQDEISNISQVLCLAPERILEIFFADKVA